MSNPVQFKLNEVSSIVAIDEETGETTLIEPGPNLLEELERIGAVNRTTTTFKWEDGETRTLYHLPPPQRDEKKD